MLKSITIGEFKSGDLGELSTKERQWMQVEKVKKQGSDPLFGYCLILHLLPRMELPSALH